MPAPGHFRPAPVAPSSTVDRNYPAPLSRLPPGRRRQPRRACHRAGRRPSSSPAGGVLRSRILPRVGRAQRSSRTPASEEPVRTLWTTTVPVDTWKDGLQYHTAPTRGHPISTVERNVHRQSIPVGSARSGDDPRPRTPHEVASRKGDRLMARLRKVWRRDDGMTTAEYAVGLIAAVAFAGILYKVVTSGTVMTALTAIVRRALSQ